MAATARAGKCHNMRSATARLLRACNALCARSPAQVLTFSSLLHSHSEAVWRKPRPPWSAFREDSFGIGGLRFKNASHAHFTWNRSACEGTDDPAHINFNRTCESIMWDSHSICPQGVCRDNSVFASVQSDSRWIVRPRSSPGAESCPSDTELTPKTACSVVELASPSASLSPPSSPALVGIPRDEGLGQNSWWVWIIITAVGSGALGVSCTLFTISMLRKFARSKKGSEQLLPYTEDAHASDNRFLWG